jgi:hypothetical protein
MGSWKPARRCVINVSLDSEVKGAFYRSDPTLREPSAWGYNWATLLLGDINTGTWPFMLGESRIWDMWSCVPRDTDPRMTVLARTLAIVNDRHLSSERMLHKDYDRKCLFETKCWSWVSSGLSPRRTASRKVTLTLIMIESFRRERDQISRSQRDQIRTGRVLGSHLLWVIVSYYVY